MAICVLIIGKSGSGKSTSMRNCADNPNFGLINVIDKPLPFKGKFTGISTRDYQRIKATIKTAKAKSVVIDDAGYLITDYFMEHHSGGNKGNGVFSLYNTLADDFYGLIKYCSMYVDSDKIIYFIMHEDKNDFGDTKPKTIGKLLDEKVCIEGMCSVVFRAKVSGGKYVFETQSDGSSVAKSPIGMFEDMEIENDLLMIDNTIRDYYGIQIKNESEEKQ